MKSYWLIYFLGFFISSPAQGQDDGFTNKVQADNITKDGAKQGRWIEYYDADERLTLDTANALTYTLTVYRSGAPEGIVRNYKKNGALRWKLRFISGKADGILESYYDNGKLRNKIPFKKGKQDGTGIIYYEDGVVQKETTYTNGVINGTDKTYYPSGKIKNYASYVNGKLLVEKNYDEAGAEIKKSK